MRLAWATDLHLEMADEAAFDRLSTEVLEAAPEVLLVGGDIATATTFVRSLEALAARLDRPIYFVLGNHDYYRGDVAGVRRRAAAVAATDARLVWLEGTGAVALTPKTALVGHGGWGDTRFGNETSPVVLNDFLLIADLQGLPAGARNARLRALGDEAASHLRAGLLEAVQREPAEVVVLTHVPPFREACWHEGKLSNGDWLPFFACKATGDVLLEVAGARPGVRFTVLCGHTHSDGEAELLPNLRVSTGGARYGQPTLARAFDVP